jgi:hypothetical protein
MKMKGSNLAQTLRYVQTLVSTKNPSLDGTDIAPPEPLRPNWRISMSFLTAPRGAHRMINKGILIDGTRHCLFRCPILVRVAKK